MRIIAHVDMDAFSASVEPRHNPALRDRPVVVGADHKDGRGRRVVEAASYAARRYGIRSAMPISRAWKLAEAARRRGEPAVAFVHGNRKLYVEVSERVMAILASAGDAFEEASIDEAYVDFSSLGDFGAACERANALKREIAEREAFGVNPLDAAFITERVRARAGEVFARVGRQGFRAFRTVTVTVRFAHFRTVTRAHTTREAMTSEAALAAAAVELLQPFLDQRENPRGTKLRLIGVRAEKLRSTRVLPLIKKRLEQRSGEHTSELQSPRH